MNERPRSREARLFSMAVAGMTQKQIASEEGVSVSRINQLINKHKRHLKWAASKETLDTAELSSHAIHCLSLEFGDPMFVGKEVVANYTDGELLRIPNLGRKTLQEVRQWAGVCPNDAEDRLQAQRSHIKSLQIINGKLSAEIERMKRRLEAIT